MYKLVQGQYGNRRQVVARQYGVMYYMDGWQNLDEGSESYWIE